jgi:hypothetical protein
MIKYIDDIFEDFPELIEKSARTPHTDNLFKVRDPDEATRNGSWTRHTGSTWIAKATLGPE